jgi:hypothetical protein
MALASQEKPTNRRAKVESNIHSGPTKSGERRARLEAGKWTLREATRSPLEGEQRNERNSHSSATRTPTWATISLSIEAAQAGKVSIKRSLSEGIPKHQGHQLKVEAIPEVGNARTALKELEHIFGFSAVRTGFLSCSS